MKLFLLGFVCGLIAGPIALIEFMFRMDEIDSLEHPHDLPHTGPRGDWPT